MNVCDDLAAEVARAKERESRAFARSRIAWAAWALAEEERRQAEEARVVAERLLAEMQMAMDAVAGEASARRRPGQAGASRRRKLR